MKKTILFTLLITVISLSLSAQIPLVYDKENTGAHYPPPSLPSYEQLPTIQLLPDAFKSFHNGSRDTTFVAWERRRNEIKASIEKFEIGPKPTNSDLLITANYTPGAGGGTLSVTITRTSNGQSLTLNSKVSLPSGTPPEEGWPALIGMSLAPSGGSVSNSIAKIDFMHDQVTTYVLGQDVEHSGDPYFLMYPEFYTGDNTTTLGVEQVGQYSAWSWGVSRLIDGMEIAAQQLVNPLPIDIRHLGVNGCSYAGKMALYSGAFDERIAAVFAQESGGGGAPAWRISHKIEPEGSVEKASNTSGMWFKQSMKTDFGGNNVYKFPHDHHELMAMVAPRALFVSGNTDFTWLSNRAVYATSKAAQKIYETLGIGDRFGYWIDGNHGHCALGEGQQPVIDAFYNKFLGGQDIEWDVHVAPTTPGFADLDYEQWYSWWGTDNSNFPPEPEGKKIWMEAECGTIGSDWEVVEDAQASNGTYVTVMSGTQSTGSAPTNAEANIAFSFEIDSIASYNVMARVNCPSADDDSFWVKIDDGDYITANGLTTTGWSWVTLANTNLDVGTHTLTIAYREDGALLDKLLVTTNSNSPNGLGDVAINCPPPNEKPVITANQSFQIDDTYQNGDLIGTLSGTDPENDTLQNWTIVEEAMVDGFVLNAATGDLTVSNVSLINFESTPVTLMVTVSDGNKTSEAEQVTIHLEQTKIPLVYSVENRGSDCPAPILPTLEELPVIVPLTDPFMRSDNLSRSTDYSDWSCRRNEIKAEIENYEIGPKPNRPDTINAVFAPEANGGVLTVNVLHNGRTLTLTSRITIPQGEGPFPAVIGMSLAGGGTGSIPSDIFTSRNIATVEFLHNQVTTYSAGLPAPKPTDPYYLLYPENIDAGQYSAWSWGVSRLIDGLEIAIQQAINPLPIDLSHMAVTGCSYAGKMSLFAGAMDERIALTIAQESGGGGAPAWRFSQTEPDGTVEKIDNTDYSWFSESMRQFSGDSVYKLPHDHHELMAMVAPRALLVTGNTDFTWLSNRSCYVSAKATKEVYNTFGIGDRMGYYIDGGHGHCAVPESQRPAIEAFVDKFLLGDTSVNTDIGVHPYPDLDAESWYDWWGTGNSSNLKPLVGVDQEFNINERIEDGGEVGIAYASDPDGDPLSDWQIEGGTGENMFSINPESGMILVADRSSIDFNNEDSYTLNVSVSDGWQRSDIVTLIIHLTNNPTGYIIYAEKSAKFGPYNYIDGDVGVTNPKGNAVFKEYSVLDPYKVMAHRINADQTASVNNQISMPASDGPTPLFIAYNGNTNELSDTEVTNSGTLNGNYKDVNIQDNVSVTITGDNFGKITIGRGTSVTFTSSELNIEDLHVNSGFENANTTNVIFTNSAAVKVKNKVKVYDDCRINVNGPEVTFYLGDQIDENGNFYVKGENTKVTANILIPNGKLKVQDGEEQRPTIMTGWFIMEKLESTGDYAYWYRESQEGSFARPVQAKSNISPSKDFDVKVYPNPVADELNIQIGHNATFVTVELTNILGIVVRKEKIRASERIKMNVNGLNSGIYLVRLLGDQIVTKKILIK
ncbi:T9SS type A sorting domain-containing protein [Mariniflexile soesokkakense]|uniref:T9SS type A sorting domain-containing protein n=1 Tax=Mariniflexile soesokkakense TaxID=1343160 RepID=A0ABV0AEM6_9FLAO